jgi:glycosyltransferase involved in cell wall biosynthesis
MKTAMKPFFSIIIPTLNEEKFVCKLLTDLVSQKFKDFEVLVVDAHSEDKTIEVVKQYSSLLRIAKIIRVKGRNVSRQRNKGAYNAKGPYLVFLDADARIKHNFLQKLATYINLHNGLLFIPAFSVSKKDPQLSIVVDFANALIRLSNKIGKPFSTGGSMILEKNFFSLIGGFPEDVPLSEDHLLVRNAFKFGVNAKFLSNIKVTFSLRRFKREGKLEMLYKYIKSTIYFLAKGKVDKQIITYEMGGHLYNKKSKKVLQDLIKINPQRLLKGFNRNIRSFIQGLDI